MSAKTTFDEMVYEVEKHALHPHQSLAANTIHNPAEPRHFMSLQAVPGRVVVHDKGMLIAETGRALVCLEVGKLVYFPIYYLPQSDVTADLHSLRRETHCPLKGDAFYYSRPVDSTPIAWSYETPFENAEELRGRIAFDPARVSITTSPH